MGVTIAYKVSGIDRVVRRFQAVTGHNFTAAAERGLLLGAKDTATFAKEYAPWRSGKLRRAITFGKGPEPLVAWATAPPIPVDGKLVPYPFFVHEGTGIYGPTGEPIRPKTAQVLRFVVPGLPRVSASGKVRRGASSVVYAKEVKGTAPAPFMTDGFFVAKPMIPIHIAESLNQAMRDAAAGGS